MAVTSPSWRCRGRDEGVCRVRAQPTFGWLRREKEEEEEADTRDPAASERQSLIVHRSCRRATGPSATKTIAMFARRSP